MGDHRAGIQGQFDIDTVIDRDRMHPGGVFGLWSDDPPDEPFLGQLRVVFSDVVAHVVRFPNPYTGGTSSNTVYLGHRAAD